MTPATGPQPSMGPDRDLDLVQDVRAGDRAAMDEILRRYWVGVVEYASGFTPSPDEAEDVAQDTFLRFWMGEISWRQSGSLRSFLYGVARNVARNRGRRWHRARFVPLDTPIAGTVPNPGPPPDELASAAEVASLLETAVAALPPRRQEIFVLSRYHDLTHDEIARVLGISRQTVANQMSAALSELRRALEPLFRQPS